MAIVEHAPASKRNTQVAYPHALQPDTAIAFKCLKFFGELISQRVQMTMRILVSTNFHTKYESWNREGCSKISYGVSTLPISAVIAASH